MIVLIAEDDIYTREGLVDILESEGFKVIAAKNGREAIELFKSESPDCICLDIMMPEINGYDVCKAIRKEDLQVPVIFLSAKSEEIDKVLGLELGADDYISKPFGVREVIARIRAVTRRLNYLKGNSSDQNEITKFNISDLIILPSELKALRGNLEIELSPRDIRILKLFSENQGKVLDRDNIYDAGWGVSHMPNSRTLDQHISQLRKRIEENPGQPEIICTVHNAGYRYI
ncbi:MAG: response regulator transcription factor [Spirochaetia bacterium]|jgi:DNA-binding response OmpR family regulator|nr:response regulator transcription factor [Spirochaetia bacterium]